MEINQSSATLWALGILGTILIGIITNATWDWIKENISFSSSKWPKLKGQWIIEHEDGTRNGEWADIRQQFGPRFRGELHTPDPSGSNRVLIQIVRGELRDKRHALFVIEQKGDDFEEMGAGMITLDPSHKTASGKSVFFGASAPQEGMSSFRMKKG